MSHHIRKPTTSIGENKGADQLCSNCKADQHLCFRFSDSTIPLLHNPRFQAASVPVQASVLVDWLVDWGLTSHQQLGSYGDGTSVYSPIRQTGEARDRTCDPWFTRRVT